MAINLQTATAIEVAAMTVWGEARGSGIRCMHAVMNVITNRVSHPGWWGSDYRGVCLHQWQFSCWNPGDPNRGQVLGVSSGDELFRWALGIASDLLHGRLRDSVAGADSYYDVSIPAPPWTIGLQPVAQIGTLRFYNTRGAQSAPST